MAVTTWVVVLEADADGDSEALGVDLIERLLEEVAGADPVALYDADRYALQVRVGAESAPEALLSAIALWRTAATRVGAPLWSMARAEVMTAAEFERERALLERDAPPLEPTDAALEALLEEAFHDALTGLPSPGVFHDRLERAVAADRRTVLLLVDIDDFAAINEQLDLWAGDEVLVATARRLSALLRPGDLVARLGGDSFGLILDDASPQAALVVADRVLERVSEPLVLKRGPVEVTASVGVALAEAGQAATQVLRNVRTALARAKDGGGGRHELFPGAGAWSSGVDDDREDDRDVDPLPDQVAYVGLLERCAAAANECTGLDGAAQIALDQVCAHTGWPAGHLYTISSTGAPEPTSVWHVDSPTRFEQLRALSDATVLTPGDGLPGAVVADGRPVCVSNVGAVDFLRADAAMSAGLIGAAALPVLVGGAVVAALEFFSERPVEPNATLIDAMSAVGAHLGRVVERERARAALRESEERLHEAQTVAGLGSWQYDIASGELKVAPEVHEIIGVEPTNSPDDLLATIHPADRDRAWHAALAASLGAGATECEVRVVRPGGELRWVSCRYAAVRDDAGIVVAVRGIVHDVTERKLVEEVLRDSEARWRRILENSSDVIGVLDEDANVISALGPETGITGTSVAAAVGCNARDFIHPLDLERFAVLWEHVLRTPGRSGPFELRVPHVDGGHRWAGATFNNLLDDPDIGGVVINARDVTDQKWAEEQVRSATVD